MKTVIALCVLLCLGVSADDTDYSEIWQEVIAKIDQLHEDMTTNATSTATELKSDLNLTCSAAKRASKAVDEAVSEALRRGNKRLEVIEVEVTYYSNVNEAISSADYYDKSLGVVKKNFVNYLAEAETEIRSKYGNNSLC